MNTKHTTSSRWKKRILLMSLMLVTGAGAVGVSKLGGDKSADKQKTVAKKGDEKPGLESGKPGTKNDGGSAGAGAGGAVMVASAGGAGPSDESRGERRDGASGGGSKPSFDDRIFDMDGPNAPSAGVPGGSGPDSRKPEGSFEKVAGGGFGGGKDTTGGGGGDGGSDPKGGPGNPGNHGGNGGSYPTLASGGGAGSGGTNPQDSAPIATPVPEPETYAMLLMGLGAVGWVAKRRGKRSN
jgi:hypothetical protein